MARRAVRRARHKARVRLGAMRGRSIGEKPTLDFHVSQPIGEPPEHVWKRDVARRILTSLFYADWQRDRLAKFPGLYSDGRKPEQFAYVIRAFRNGIPMSSRRTVDKPAATYVRAADGRMRQAGSYLSPEARRARRERAKHGHALKTALANLEKVA